MLQTYTIRAFSNRSWTTLIGDDSYTVGKYLFVNIRVRKTAQDGWEPSSLVVGNFSGIFAKQLSYLSGMTGNGDFVAATPVSVTMASGSNEITVHFRALNSTHNDCFITGVVLLS